MAKPVAVDVPGTLAVGALGKEATRRNLCFLVDYQAPTDPINAEIRRRILDGALGKLAYVCTYGHRRALGRTDAKTPREEYLRNSLWLYHLELAAEPCVSFDIHAIDTAMWVLGRRPVAAMGFSANLPPGRLPQRPRRRSRRLAVRRRPVLDPSASVAGEPVRADGNEPNSVARSTAMRPRRCCPTAARPISAAARSTSSAR